MSLLPEINQASAEINKFVAQANIHQTIAPVNPAAFTDPADTMLQASRDPVIREVSVGMTGVEAASYTVSGTPPLSLPNSLGKPLKAWSVDLLPYQAGTGDPAPDNVRPIHGTDKLTITTAGKNLCDGNVYGSALFAGVPYVDSLTPVTSPFVTSGGYRGVGFIIPVTAGHTYALSSDIDVGSGFFCGVYSELADMTNKANCIEHASAGTGIYTPQHNGYMLFMRYAANLGTTITWSWGQAELGSTVTEFTPYLTPSQTVLTLPQTVYTGTIGSEGGESRSTMVDMGSIAWVRDGSTNYWYGEVKLQQPFDNNLCESMKYSNTKPATGDNAHFYRSGGNYIEVWNDTAQSEEEVQQALQGVKLVYLLVNPTTFAVPSVTIPTPTGTATTWATAEDGTVESMEVTYVGRA